MTEKGKVTESTWSWLDSIRFGGSAWINRGDERYSHNVILVLEERDCVADLLLQPLHFLSNTVGLLASQVIRLRRIVTSYAEKTSNSNETIRNTFLETRWPGPLGAYIESRVWTSLRLHPQGSGFSGNFANARYRAMTMVGTPPIDKKMIEATAESARIQARSTF
jgi:hypothetical protein